MLEKILLTIQNMVTKVILSINMPSCVIISCHLIFQFEEL